MRAEVPQEGSGERLDAFLAGSLGSRTRAQAAIAAGGVRVNGQPVAKSRRLEAGDVVEVDEAEPAPAPAAGEDGGIAPYGIAWEDERVLVVDKPAGVVTHPAPGHATGTLVQALEAGGEGGAGLERAGIVHRLDRDTSGLLVVARDEEALRQLQGAMERREIGRDYLALVAGRPQSRTGTIDAPIGRDRRQRTRHSVDTDTPREAITHFEVEEELPGATLLRVRLETGRTHQIRAHLAAIGLPIAGDPEYGVAGALGLDRQFLHATRLRFRSPAGGDVDVSSPLPADLADALERARGGEPVRAAAHG